MNILELWDKYHIELKRYILKTTHNNEDAEDISSEVFLKLMQNKNTIERMSDKQSRVWIYTTAKHIIIDISRKKKLQARILPETELTFDDLSTASVGEAIGILPHDLQDLVAMRYFSDMDSTTIGKILNIPPATVRTKLRKACAILRRNWNCN